jgi:hypothetical protein
VSPEPELLPDPPDPPLDDEDVASAPPSTFSLLLTEPPQLVIPPLGK